MSAIRGHGVRILIAVIVNVHLHFLRCLPRDVSAVITVAIVVVNVDSL
jgi:hypothetical protein